MNYREKKSMSKFEKREGYSREDYDKTAEDEASLKTQIAGAKTADEMMAIAMKLKEAEGNKKELDNVAYDEAVAEDQEIAKQKKEEAENKMWDEALAENAEFDQNKALDKAAENLKNQLSQAKSADEMIELAKQMKEIESRKSKLAENSKKELEIASQKDKSDSSEKVEKIISGLGGMMGDGLLTDKDVAEIKKAESNSMKETEKNLGMFESGEKIPEKSSKELNEQYKDLNNLAGVNLGTPEYSQKVEELLQLAKKRGNYTQLEGQASEDAHNEMAETLKKRLKANTEIMAQLEREDAGKIKEMLDTPRVLELKRVKEKEYKEHILDDLKNNIPQDKEVMVLMLKDKIGSFEDKTSPVFVYGKENVGEATKVINEWVDNIDSKHYMLPALATEYLFSIMSEDQFEKAVENPSLVVDGNLRKAIEKYKSAVEKEKSPEEKMDDYIEKFKKIGGEHGVYNLMFQTMRDDKDIDFLNNDEMIMRFIKGMGNVDAVSMLNAYVYPDKKKFSKDVVLKIINAVPENQNETSGFGPYNELRILAINAGLEKDENVIEAIARKDRMIGAALMGSNYKAADTIIKNGPDAYFKK